jgi:hypothetical protein
MFLREDETAGDARTASPPLPLPVATKRNLGERTQVGGTAIVFTPRLMR